MNGLFVSLSKLDRADKDVRRELTSLGLLTKRLDKVDVYLVSPFIPEVPYGYYLEKSAFFLESLGWEPGHIYIPSLRLGAILRIFGFAGSCSLRHVLRHEYGHALAHKHPTLVRRSREFTSVFGGRYDRATPVSEGNPIDFANYYAATKPCEDFAETFALYVRCKGNIENFAWRMGLYSKLCFVRELNEMFLNQR